MEGKRPPWGRADSPQGAFLAAEEVLCWFLLVLRMIQWLCKMSSTAQRCCPETPRPTRPDMLGSKSSSVTYTMSWMKSLAMSRVVLGLHLLAGDALGVLCASRRLTRGLLGRGCCELCKKGRQSPWLSCPRLPGTGWGSRFPSAPTTPLHHQAQVWQGMGRCFLPHKPPFCWFYPQNRHI